MNGRLVSVNVGAPRELAWEGETVTSGIFKDPVDGPLHLTATGFVGDVQADRRAHGGPDKAACVFGFDHYSFWQDDLGRSLQPGAFGENLTIEGISEDDVCVGDTFSLGEAVVQVAQPREPCHKLAKKFQVKDIGPRLLERGSTGFYFRVLQEGQVRAGDSLELQERERVLCSISFMNSIQWSGFYKTRDLADRARQLLQVESLISRWRDICERKIEEDEKQAHRGDDDQGAD